MTQNELRSRRAVRARKAGTRSVRIPVEWCVVGFDCSVIIPAEWRMSAANGAGPVRLRVSDVAGGCCRLEIFCGEEGLCGVSAG